VGDNGKSRRGEKTEERGISLRLWGPREKPGQTQKLSLSNLAEGGEIICTHKRFADHKGPLLRGARQRGGRVNIGRSWELQGKKAQACVSEEKAYQDSDAQGLGNGGNQKKKKTTAGGLASDESGGERNTPGP